MSLEHMDALRKTLPPMSDEEAEILDKRIMLASHLMNGCISDDKYNEQIWALDAKSKELAAKSSG